jgi:hypothetical protein
MGFVGLSMIKVFIFSLAICNLSYQQCRVLDKATMYFENYRDCALHGYEYSYKLLEVLDTEVMEKEQIYTSFICKEIKNI